MARCTVAQLLMSVCLALGVFTAPYDEVEAAQGTRLPEAGTAAATLSRSKCAGLGSLDISAEVGTPVKITSAQTTASSPSAAEEVCEITGYVNPQIEFRLLLPLQNWNGKFLEIGNGGMAGSIPINASASGSTDPVAVGYGVIFTNGGHHSTGADAVWADHDLPALVDYSYRAVHVGSLVGKAIVAHAYGRAVRFAYFAGCSDGGREALILAQRFPNDFNGIIAGAPSMRLANIFVNLYWLGEHIGATRPDGPLSIATLTVLHEAALRQCAGVSSLAHGNLVHPEACTVDARRLACKSGAVGGCLSSSEVADAEAAYRGPRRSDGSLVAPPSVMPGSELEWTIMADARLAAYPREVFRHIAFGAPPAPGWKNGDPDLDVYPASMAAAEALWSATNPDLRSFKAAGGKLLSYMGWNDPIGGVRDTLDYFATVRRTMGDAKTVDDFYRLYMVPGMAHCGGGSGAFEIDYLDYLDKWVTQGAAPAALHGKHPTSPQSDAFEEDIPKYQ